MGTCGTGGYFLYAWATTASISDETRYMPSGTQVVVSIRVDQAINSDLYKQLKEVSKSNPKTGFDDDELAKKHGISLADVDRMTIAGSVADEQTVVIFRMKNAVTGAGIRGNTVGNFHETTINGTTIYEDEAEAATKGASSFIVPESKIVVFGRFKDLRNIVERDKVPDFPDGMVTAMKRADFNKTTAFAINVKDIAQKAGSKLKTPPPAVDPNRSKPSAVPTTSKPT
jgi:hypothetical protein